MENKFKQTVASTLKQTKVNTDLVTGGKKLELKIPIGTNKKEEAPAPKKVTSIDLKQKVEEMKTKKIDPSELKRKEAETKIKIETNTEAKKVEEKVEETKEILEETKISSLDEITDFDTAMAETFEDNEDEAWKEFKKEALSKLKEIKIESNMNAVAINTVLSQLTELKDFITPNKIKYDSLYKKLTDKETGLITVVKLMNSDGKGNVKKINEIAALQNHVSKAGHKINLIALLNSATDRQIFLTEISNGIEYKRSVCVTITASKNKQ